MNPTDPQNPEQQSEERPRVAPPVFTPPKIVAPDSVVQPGVAPSQVEAAHPEADVRGVLTPKLVTSEPEDYDDDEEDDPEIAEQPAAQPVQTSQSPAAATAQPPVARKPKYKFWLIVAAYVAAAMLSAFLTFTILKAVYGSRVSVATEFVQDLQAGKADPAYAMTSAKFKDTTAKDVFQEYAEQESAVLPKVKPTYVSKQNEEVGGTAVVAVVLNLKGGTEGGDYNAVIRLVKEDGRWVVFSADIKPGLYSEPLSTSR